MLALDASGAIVEVNNAAENFFDMGRAALPRSPLADLLPFGSPVFALVADAIASQSTSTATSSIFPRRAPAPGGWSTLLSRLCPASRRRRLLLQERSIAEKMDRQLTHRSAARSVTALGAMLAHEIKNPLSGIRGAAQLLEASVSDEDRALTQLICEETDRIVKLVDRMESFSDERPAARESLNIHAVLDHVKRLAQAGFARHIRFVAIYDPSLPHVFGARDQLVQVFLNLVKNAAEAIGDETIDGEITITTAYRAGVRLKTAASAEPVSLPLEICIRDNGPGVPAEIAGNLFDPVRHHQVLGVWPGTCTCRQSHRRPWRYSRMRIPSAQNDLSRADAAGVGPRDRRARKAEPEARIRPRPSRGSSRYLRAATDRRRGAREQMNAVRPYSRRRRRRGDPNRPQPGAFARGLRSACDRHGRRTWRWVAAGEGDLVITDVVMPDDNAFELLPRIKRHAAGAADHRHERAEHVHDRDQGLRTRRL